MLGRLFFCFYVNFYVVFSFFHFFFIFLLFLFVFCLFLLFSLFFRFLVFLVSPFLASREGDVSSGYLCFSVFEVYFRKVYILRI